MKSAEMVEETLHKIKSIDHSGYELRSVLAVSSQALDQAREYDKSSANLPLAGFPILIKDNIEAIGPIPPWFAIQRSLLGCGRQVQLSSVPQIYRSGPTSVLTDRQVVGQRWED
jgi:hypothetical protein